MAKMNTTPPVFQVKSMALLHVDPGSILLAVSYLISHFHDHSNSYTVQYSTSIQQMTDAGFSFQFSQLKLKPASDRRTTTNFVGPSSKLKNQESSFLLNNFISLILLNALEISGLSLKSQKLSLYSSQLGNKPAYHQFECQLLEYIRTQWQMTQCVKAT